MPGKNVRRLAGHPLLAYAIETARQSGVFERIVVSTDSEEIAKVARWYGADVPFLRPDEYATATSPDIEWIAWTLPRLEERYDLFAIVRATNPFRGPDVIRRGLEQLLATPEADSIRAVERVKQHPGKMWELTIDGRTMLPLLDQSHLDVAWHAGQYQALPAGLRPEQRARDRLDARRRGDRHAGGARARAVPDRGVRGPQHRRRGRLRARRDRSSRAGGRRCPPSSASRIQGLREAAAASSAIRTRCRLCPAARPGARQPCSTVLCVESPVTRSAEAGCPSVSSSRFRPQPPGRAAPESVRKGVARLRRAWAPVDRFVQRRNALVAVAARCGDRLRRSGDRLAARRLERRDSADYF